MDRRDAPLRPGPAAAPLPDRDPPPRSGPAAPTRTRLSDQDSRPIKSRSRPGLASPIETQALRRGTRHMSAQAEHPQSRSSNRVRAEDPYPESTPTPAPDGHRDAPPRPGLASPIETQILRRETHCMSAQTEQSGSTSKSRVTTEEPLPTAAPDGHRDAPPRPGPASRPGLASPIETQILRRETHCMSAPAEHPQSRSSNRVPATEPSHHQGARPAAPAPKLASRRPGSAAEPGQPGQRRIALRSYGVPWYTQWFSQLAYSRNACERQVTLGCTDGSSPGK